MKWRFIYSGEQNCYYNMAVDEAILFFVHNGISPPTVRIYRWDERCVSIGYRQVVKHGINLKVPLVRRLTGGGLVFHDQEYTISVIARYADSPGFKNLLETYFSISNSILDALAALGIDGRFRGDERRLNCRDEKVANKYRESCGIAVCFDDAADYEIVCRGRKIVGSAQKRAKKAFLQQSSIPFFIDRGLFPDISNILMEVPENFPKKREERCVFLEKFSAMPFPSEEEIVNKFKKSFEKTLNIDFFVSNISKDEKNMANLMKREKYSLESWNYFSKISAEHEKFF